MKIKQEQDQTRHDTIECSIRIKFKSMSLSQLLHSKDITKYKKNSKNFRCCPILIETTLESRLRKNKYGIKFNDELKSLTFYLIGCKEEIDLRKINLQLAGREIHSSRLVKLKKSPWMWVNEPYYEIISIIYL